MLMDLVALVDCCDKSPAAFDMLVAFSNLHHACLDITLIGERVPAIAAVDPQGYGFALLNYEQEQERRCAEARRQIARCSVPASLRSALSDHAGLKAIVRGESRCTDLLLLLPKAGWLDRRLRHRIAEEAVRGIAPVLLVPNDWKPKLIQHAVLGWNDSCAAGRAAHALTAIAAPNAIIDIVMVDPPEGASGERGEQIRRHLAHHGFDVRLHVRPSRDRDATTALEHFAATAQADVLAVGAFSHSPLRENLLGGVTRDLIDRQILPVLMAH
jgi:nucleotide-binding universal stress UspA family protein